MSPYLDKPALSERDRMLQNLRDRATYWRAEAMRFRSSDKHGEDMASLCDNRAYELEWAVKQIEES
jgi:hypothetical protein